MGNLIFITGGVRSGKSAFAEKYAVEFYEKFNKEKLIYIASGVAFDEEMERRIERHQHDRKISNYQWHTIEIQDDLNFDENVFCEKQVILWDCITTWLNNILFKTEKLNNKERLEEIEKYINNLKEQIQFWIEQNYIVLVVSNEVLDEHSSPYSEVNLYRSLLGNLHQWFVNNSDEAYELDYGEKIRWK